MIREDSPVRKAVYDAIRSFPGIHFRELLRKCSVSTGQLSHHVSYLKRIQLIKEEKHGRNARFFPLGLNERERSILGILRNPTSRHLVISLLQHFPQTHKQLSSSVSLSASTLSWYLDQLKMKGIISMQKKGKEHYYALNDRAEIAKVLIAHRQSFLDTIVDNFIESWEH